jgi:hypothetical protein
MSYEEEDTCQMRRIHVICEGWRVSDSKNI